MINETDRRLRLQDINQVIGQGPFAASWDSLESFQAPRWYQDGKFGIFIHWGLYSVPAFGNEWYPRNMYAPGSREFEHHVRTYGPQDRFGYKDFIPLFRAEHFDPEAWADLFRDAGARFVVPVAEHHDGFQMYDSRLSRWNAVRMGPRRDVLDELGAAVRRRGMVLGASSHRAEHWWFMGEGRTFRSDVQDPAWADFYGPAQAGPGGDNYLASQPDQAYLEDWLLRTCELIENYRPQLLWFDWWIMNLAFKPYLKKMAAYYYNRAKEWGLEVAVNHKFDAFPVSTAVFDIERGQLAGIRSLFWQTDTAVQKNSWGYTEQQDYKTVAGIIGDLADIVSKNGALLLNIGPRADGTIPEPEQAMLREIGAWLRANGEAIYGTRPWCLYGEGPTLVSEGAFTDTSRAPYQADDIRFTVKDQALYAILLACPAGSPVAVRHLGRESMPAASPFKGRPVAEVILLDGGLHLPFDQTADALQTRLPADYRSPNPVALKIAFASR